MSEIQFMEKPDWVSWEMIHECLVAGHEFNKKKGVYMVTPTWNPDELKEHLKDGRCFVAIDDGKVVGTCSLKISKPKQWWAMRENVAITCMDAVVPGYKGTDVFMGLNEIRNQCINDLGLRIIAFSTHENNKVVQKINLKQGAKYVRYCSFADTNHYSVVMAYWLDGCPFSDRYCDFRFKLSKYLTKLVFKKGRKFRFLPF